MQTFKNITGLRNHDNWKHGTTGNEKGSHAGSGDHTCDICQKVGVDLPTNEIIVYHAIR